MAFFVVLGLSFYLTDLRKRDGVRMAAAFVALSAGLLVHYSAAPYCVFAAAFYLACVFPRRERKWRELAWIGTTGLLLTLTWFGWAAATYGARAAFLSSGEISDAMAYHGTAVGEDWIEHLSLTGAIYSAGSGPRALFRPAEPPRFLSRQYFHLLREQRYFFDGSGGGPVGARASLSRYWRRRGAAGAERRFWLLLVPFCIVLRIAVVGVRRPVWFGPYRATPVGSSGTHIAFGSIPSAKDRDSIIDCRMRGGFFHGRAVASAR